MSTPRSRPELFAINRSVIKSEEDQVSRILTLESVDSPLFEFLQSDLCCWWDFIEVQAMRIVLLLEYRRCELLLLVIKSGPPLRVNSVGVLSNHLDSRCHAVLDINSLFWSVAFPKPSDYRSTPLSRRDAPGTRARGVFT